MKLFIPGPVSVRKDVLAKMATEQIGHRTNSASSLQKNISSKLQTLWETKEEILLSTSSGSGLMEGAIRSCTKKRAAVFSVGNFGKSWYKMAISNNVPADLYQVENGMHTTAQAVDEVLSTKNYDLFTITHNETSTGVTNPIKEISEIAKKYPDIVFCVDMVSSAGGIRVPVDKLAIDICITSTQKCLGLPPGMAACTFSTKALNRAKEVENRGSYFDLLALYNTIQSKNYQYPSTPSISHMYALDYQLEHILNIEGLENRYNRHKEMAEIVRNWAKEKFEVFPDEKYSSDTVTTIKNTLKISVADLNKELQKEDMMISNGYGDLKEKTFRIAHMADTTVEEIETLLTTINKILKL